jgi:predicted PurR-regulated permease PerM
MKEDRVVRVEITGKTILFTVAVILFLFFIRSLTDLFLNLFIAFILMSALKPVVDWFENKKLPRPVASVFTIVFCLLAIFLVFYFVLPPLVTQSVDFLVYLSRQFILVISQLDRQLTVRDFINLPALTQQIPSFTAIVSRAFMGFFTNLFNLLTIFFFTLYFLLGINQLDRLVRRFLGKNQANFVSATLRGVEKQLGLWVRAELVLMLIIGIFSYIGLTFLGVKYALPLAVIAGILEVFPIVGPVISAIPAFIVGATSSWILGAATIVLYTLIQQLENNLIVPLVMKKAVGIPPLAVLISLIVGQKIAGFFGIVLAVPFVAGAVIIVKEILKYRKTNL